MQDKTPIPHTGDDADEQELAALLRAAGPRAQATSDVAASVRAAVEAEWRATVAARDRRRRAAPWLAVASVATVAIAAWLAQPLYRPAAGPVATVALVAGAAQVRNGTGGAWHDLYTGDAVTTGGDIRTLATGRVALHLTGGVEVRLDTATTLRLEDSEAASLADGAIYVDVGTGPAQPFVLTTTLGKVRHLGTQYLVRTSADALRVSVREGRVAVEQGGDSVIANAGDQLSITPSGRVARSALGPQDAAFAWLAAITPPFAIDGRSLDEFLAWAARETGRMLVYASPAAAQEAASIRLRGSVTELAPEAAIAAVLVTTPSLQAEIGARQLRLQRKTE